MQQSLDAVFKPLIGQLTWQVEAGYGSFLTLEFGAPHLFVREPIVGRQPHTPRVREHLARRQITIVGDWHLLIQHAEWTISSSAGNINSTTPTRDGWQAVLDNLSGQRLLSAESNGPSGVLLRFDLGGMASLAAPAGGDADCWSLHNWNGDIISVRSDGTLTRETGRSQ